MSKTAIERSFEKLKDYCEAENFKGYDPYDSLNSRFFNALPGISKNRIARLAWIQFNKRSPVNLRRFTGVSKSYNAKALGLFLSSYCALYQTDPKKEYLDHARYLVDQIRELRVPGRKNFCWGYNFPWQARFFYQPKHTPNIVVSTFVAHGLLDAYDLLQDQELLKMARSACDFILEDLNRTYDADGDFCFSYTPNDKVVVYNASLLGSKLLSRVYSYTREPALIAEARKAVTFSCKAQREDGSWGYGNLPFNQWVDSFHTGYNLECIQNYMNFSGDTSFQSHVDKGYAYYIKTFFTSEGVSKYYSHATYPIDVHAPAQLVITLVHLDKKEEQEELLQKVLSWTIRNMQHSSGYFYYQKNKYFLSRIPYMRWSQAWMFYALSTYLSHTRTKVEQPETAGRL